jgi:hypothetical protein
MYIILHRQKSLSIAANAVKMGKIRGLHILPEKGKMKKHHFTFIYPNPEGTIT